MELKLGLKDGSNPLNRQQEIRGRSQDDIAREFYELYGEPSNLCVTRKDLTKLAASAQNETSAEDLVKLEANFESAFDKVKDQKSLRKKSQEYKDLSKAFFQVITAKGEAAEGLKESVMNLIQGKYGSVSLDNVSGSSYMAEGLIMAKVLRDDRGSFLRKTLDQVKSFEELRSILLFKKKEIAKVFNFKTLEFKEVKK